MGYRFKLAGHDVECDSLEELVAAVGTGEATPTTTTRRARLTDGKNQKCVSAGQQSWALATFYSIRRGVELTVKEARSVLAGDPKLKARIAKKYAEAQ